jgi:hypothetical protein
MEGRGSKLAGSGEQRLRAALRKLRPGSGNREPQRADAAALNLEPSNPFEVAVAERLKALQADVDEIRTRVNWLLTFIVGAAVTNVVIALLK